MHNPHQLISKQSYGLDGAYKWFNRLLEQVRELYRLLR